MEKNFPAIEGGGWTWCLVCRLCEECLRPSYGMLDGEPGAQFPYPVDARMVG